MTTRPRTYLSPRALSGHIARLATALADDAIEAEAEAIAERDAAWAALPTDEDAEGYDAACERCDEAAAAARRAQEWREVTGYVYAAAREARMVRRSVGGRRSAIAVPAMPAPVAVRRVTA